MSNPLAEGSQKVLSVLRKRCVEDYRSDYANDTRRGDVFRLDLYDGGAKQPCPEDGGEEGENNV
jgi:hypothetical protein